MLCLYLSNSKLKMCYQFLSLLCYFSQELKQLCIMTKDKVTAASASANIIDVVNFFVCVDFTYSLEFLIFKSLIQSVKGIKSNILSEYDVKKYKL